MDGDPTVILLADAMVLIDLDYLGAVGTLPQIGPAEVLDVVLEECRSPRQLKSSDVKADRREPRVWYFYV